MTKYFVALVVAVRTRSSASVAARLAPTLGWAAAPVGTQIEPQGNYTYFADAAKGGPFAAYDCTARRCCDGVGEPISTAFRWQGRAKVLIPAATQFRDGVLKLSVA